MKTRIKYIIFIACVLAAKFVDAQQNAFDIPDGIYYIVRHAEKDTGINPGLTKAGMMRSGDLYRELKTKKIGRIYVSQYRRTQMTADSLRLRLKLDTLHYTADNSGDGLVQQITRQRKQLNVLIIAHSNTIPTILNRLGVSGLVLQDIPDEEYDNLFVVTVKKKKVSLKWLKYGKTPVKNNSGKMQPLQ